MILALVFRNFPIRRSSNQNFSIMKPLMHCSAVLLLLASFSFVHAQNMTEQQQQAYMNYMTPGPVHQWMARGVGEWKVETKMWWDENSKEPTLATGTCNNSMILGGRYLQSKHTSDVMGMPFEGIATTGYDNGKKIFISSWIDNMGTGMYQMEGTLDEKTNTITMKGKAFDPVTGKDCTVREVQKFVDDNTMMMEYFVNKGGKEYKSMELKLTRK
jgi:hypothetical protein